MKTAKALFYLVFTALLFIGIGAINVHASQKVSSEYLNVKKLSYVKTTKKLKVGNYPNTENKKVGGDFYLPKNTVVQLLFVYNSHGKTSAYIGLNGYLSYGAMKKSHGKFQYDSVKVPMKKDMFKQVKTPSSLTDKQFLIGKPKLGENAKQFMLTSDNYLEYYSGMEMIGVNKPSKSVKIANIKKVGKNVYVYLKQNITFLTTELQANGTYRLTVKRGPDVKLQNKLDTDYKIENTYRFGNQDVWHANY